MTSLNVLRWRVRRLRRALPVTVMALLLSAGAASATASSDWSDWQPIPAGPNDASCGTTVVHVDFPRLDAYYRQSSPSADILLIQTKGTSTVRFRTDAGAELTFHQAGPGLITVNLATGDVTTLSQGEGVWGLTPEQAAEFGAPSQIVWAAGLTELVSHADGSLTPIRIPPRLVDICAQLAGAGS